jgi:hypothetical protein
VGLPETLIGADKVIGYLAQTPTGMYYGMSFGKILITDSAEKLLHYLDDRDLEQKIKIKKINFSDLAEKINNGCSVVFDKGTYTKFASIAALNLIDDIPMLDLSKADDDTFVACISVYDQVPQTQGLH